MHRVLRATAGVAVTVADVMLTLGREKV